MVISYLIGKVAGRSSFCLVNELQGFTAIMQGCLIGRHTECNY